MQLKSLFEGPIDHIINLSFFGSVRKRADDLKNDLENIVIPMFCSADLSE